MELSRDLVVGIGTGLTVGSLLFMTLYALYLFWLNWDSAYLFYVLYSGINCYQILLKSFVLELIVSIPRYMYIPEFEKLTYVPYSLFVAKLVELSTHSPRRWHILMATLILYSGVTLYLISDTYYNPYTFFNALSHYLMSIHSFHLFLFLLDLSTVFLLCFLWYVAWRSQKFLRGYLLSMITLTMVTLLGPIIYHSISIKKQYDFSDRSTQAGLATFDWRDFLGRFEHILKSDSYEKTRF